MLKGFNDVFKKVGVFAGYYCFFKLTTLFNLCIPKSCPFPFRVKAFKTHHT
jgi:hypothetical protein